MAVPVRQRVVEVEADLGEDSDPRYRYGSGLLVSGQTVLTAAHAVIDAVAVTVRRSDKLRWSAELDGALIGDVDRLDLALLDVRDLKEPFPSLRVATVDRDTSAGDQMIEGCWSVGYPLFQEVERDADGHVVRETAQVHGQIPPLSGLVEKLLTLEVTKAPRDLPGPGMTLGESQWSGMSGAAVLAGDVLVGVVAEHARRRGSSDITVTPLGFLDDPDRAPANPAQWWERLGVSDPSSLVRLPAKRAEIASEQIVVGELPGVPPALIARDALAEMAEIFDAGGRVVVISGGRGTGKTQVAAEYARKAVADGVRLVAWVSGEGHERLLFGLAEVARGLGVADPEGDSEASARRLRDGLNARVAAGVLVIDNATDPPVVRRYLPATGQTRVIITSTDRAFRTAGTEIEVDVFDPADSVVYLTERTRLADGAGAQAVADELGHLPLALAQAGSVIELQGLTYPVYLDRLRSLPLEEMLPADRGDSYPHGVAAAVLLSVEAVREDDPDGLAGGVLSSMALLAGEGVARGMLAQIIGVTEGQLQRLDNTLAGLVATSLVVWTKDRGGVVMHRLVARAIRDRFEHAGELAERLADVANGLQPLLVSEESAWEHRDASAEIVGHAIAVWQHAVSATARDAATRDDLQSHADLAHWAVRHLRATADLSRAVDIGESVLADLERVLGAAHPNTLTARSNLAYAYASAGDLGRAISLYEQTLADCERVLGADHPDTLTARNDLAYAYASAGDLGRAIPLYEQTLADLERVLGSDHPDTLTARNNLAAAYEAAGDLGRAIPLYEQTLADCERVLGADHPDTLGSRNNLAAAYEAAGDLGRAIPLFEQTLADCERVLGADHPNTLTARNNLAGAHRSAGDLGRAIPLLEQTLADCERVLGADHPDTLTARSNLAGAYASAGDLGRAISLFEQTLADCERVLGADHPNTLTARNNLAYAYRSAGDLGRAIPLLEQTLADCERVLGADHPDTLGSRSNLAYAHRSAGDLGRAIPLYEQTLADCERVLGADHPNTLTGRSNLAGAHRSAGDLGRAIPLLEQTLADCERVLGADHPNTLTARSNLAAAYEAAGDLGRAIPLLEQTLADLERVLGADHPNTLTGRNNLAYAYESAGDLGRAIPLLEQTLANRERVLGADHPDTLGSRNNLAGAHQAAGDLGRAIPLYEQTLADCERVLGADHPTTKVVRDNLGEARVKSTS